MVNLPLTKRLPYKRALCNLAYTMTLHYLKMGLAGLPSALREAGLERIPGQDLHELLFHKGGADGRRLLRSQSPAQQDGVVGSAGLSEEDLREGGGRGRRPGTNCI